VKSNFEGSKRGDECMNAKIKCGLVTNKPNNKMKLLLIIVEKFTGYTGSKVQTKIAEN